MWWRCDVKFFRTVLRLKVWARSEPEARSKIERMYQVATIQTLSLADSDAIASYRKSLPESVAN